MPFFNEVWCEDHNIRIARLEETLEFLQGNRVALYYVRPPVASTPIPSSALCIRSTDRPQSMTAGLRRVLNPEFYINDFVMGRCDTVERDYDMMRGEHHEHVFRTVLTVALDGPPTSVADVTSKMQRWSQFFANHGWIPEDPQTVYELWCEAEGVTPEITPAEMQWASETRAKERLRQLFAARETRCTQEDADRISNRIRAASASERTYQQAMQSLGDAVSEWTAHAVSFRGRSAEPIHRMIQSFLDADQIADLRVYDIVHRRDSLAGSTTITDNPFQPRPVSAYGSPTVQLADVVAQIHAATAALPGVRIPLHIKGARPLNLEE